MLYFGFKLSFEIINLDREKTPSAIITKSKFSSDSFEKLALITLPKSKLFKIVLNFNLSLGIFSNRNFNKVDLFVVVYLFKSSLNWVRSISHILFGLFDLKKLTFVGKKISEAFIFLKPILLSNLILFTDNCIP